MKTPRKTMFLMIIVVFSAFLLASCGSKTEVKYIVPTGYVVEMRLVTREPVNIVINKTESVSNATGNTANESKTVKPSNASSGPSNPIDYSTVVQPTSMVNGSYVPYEADINTVKAKLCSINEVILGYVGCYYNANKTAARVTLKDTGRGDIDEMWFYLVFAGNTIHLKSEGFTVGNINDYTLLLSDWSKRYNGKIQRILITPVVKEGNYVFVCNNRQLLLIPEQSCREVVD